VDNENAIGYLCIMITAKPTNHWIGISAFPRIPVKVSSPPNLMGNGFTTFSFLRKGCADSALLGQSPKQTAPGRSQQFKVIPHGPANSGPNGYLRMSLNLNRVSRIQTWVHTACPCARSRRNGRRDHCFHARPLGAGQATGRGIGQRAGVMPQATEVPPRWRGARPKRLRREQ
jgi:hypothetical protein